MFRRRGGKLEGAVGNELIDRAHPDGASRITFIDRDLVFARAGKVVSWDVFTGRAGTMRMQVWRPAAGGADPPTTFTLGTDLPGAATRLAAFPAVDRFWVALDRYKT